MQGILGFVPAVAVTAAGWSLLPSPYQVFDQGVPAWLVFVENGLRVVVIPLMAPSTFGRRGERPVAGWWLYGTGLRRYVGSYLAQVFLPRSGWSASAVGFAAPAWTTAFWLLGIGLATRPWPAFSWTRPTYLPAAAAFVVGHLTHALWAFAAA